MTEHTEKNKKQPPFELIAAIIMGILAIGCFITQISTLTSETTQLETVLFNTLQFLLTTGFAWFGSRASSRNEFENSIKQFAISAYRRISDIEKMLERLQQEITTMTTILPTDEQQNLRVIDAIVYDTVQVVKSSSDDWADVIGQELLAIEKIRRLEHERKEIKSLKETTGEDSAQEEKIHEIENQINILRAKLPALLNIASQETKESYSFSPATAAMWIVEKHKSEGGLEIRVVAGKGYSNEPNPEKIDLNQDLFIANKGEKGLDIVDQSGKSLGRALNFSPYTYDQFQSAMELCYGLGKAPVVFTKIIDEYARDKDKYIQYYVRIKKNPQFENPFRNRMKKSPSTSKKPSRKKAAT